ncbi:MAG TPA: DNA-processing protein DprA [Patescibacteria group bacterium]|nr:DNA-processing protein DprA [Patescibacteria group bacterium]
MPETDQTDRLYTLGFVLLQQISPARFEKILRVFQSPEVAWKAPLEEYLSRGLPPDVVRIVEARRRSIDVNQEWEKLEQAGISFITRESPEYPPLLKEIHNPPIGLFVRGTIPEYTTAVAIVGTRKATHYGLGVTQTIAAELARQKILVVSGLAYGVDTAAHSAVVKNHGQTIAVLGGGIDNKTLYPQSNRKLAQNISDRFGAVISEYPIGTPSLTYHFPNRNRIISGLSQATVVIEADLQSGSLITARFALEQNREVFAVPGNITNPYAAGPNALLKQGAHPLISVEDIFDILNIPSLQTEAKAKKLFPSSPDERALFALLGDAPSHVDEITRSSKLDTKTVNSTLTIMEMKGLVRHIGAGMYTKG